MSDTSVVALIIGVVSAAGSVSGLAAFLTHRRLVAQEKRDAEIAISATAKSLVETSLSMVTPLTKATAEAESRISAMQARVTELEQTVSVLSTSLASMTARAEMERLDWEHRLVQAKSAADAECARLQSELVHKNAEIAELRVKHHVRV